MADYYQILNNIYNTNERSDLYNHVVFVYWILTQRLSVMLPKKFPNSGKNILLRGIIFNSSTIRMRFLCMFIWDLKDRCFLVCCIMVKFSIREQEAF